ncbi:MAG: hypothetical protein QG567_1908, partial [Campylobacterota bacterium]|nr:hypothetical protein [Campylobacterota bacterium]
CTEQSLLYRLYQDISKNQESDSGVYRIVFYLYMLMSTALANMRLGLWRLQHETLSRHSNRSSLWFL